VQDLDKAIVALLEALTAGELTPIEAAEIAMLVEAHRRTIEMAELEKRLQRAARSDRTSAAAAGSADGAATLDRLHHPPPQVQGDRCRHDDISAVSTDIVESQLLIQRNQNML
jgi:hypothetical protein